MQDEENHVSLPAKVAKEEVVLQKPTNSTTDHESPGPVSATTSTTLDVASKPTSTFSTSPLINVSLPSVIAATSPRKPSPPLIASQSSPFTSPTLSDQGARGITSPATDNRRLTSPIVDGIIGVLCPTSSNTSPKKTGNLNPFELSPFSPFLTPNLG